jgi:hypothetical protein
LPLIVNDVPLPPLLLTVTVRAVDAGIAGRIARDGRQRVRAVG